MKKFFIIFSILLYAVFSWSYRIGIVPKFNSSIDTFSIYMGVLGSVLTLIFVFIFSYLLSSSYRTSLLSSLLFILSPFSYEESRGGSFYVFMSLVFLGVVTIFTFGRRYLPILKNEIISFISVSSIFIGVSYLFSKPNWFFDKKLSDINLHNLPRIFDYLSTQFFFFKNPSFFQGGDKEWGLTFLSLSVFLIIGFFSYFRLNKSLFSLWIIIPCLYGVFSPYFPEVREMYLVVPLLSFTTGAGLSYLSKINKLPLRKLILIPFVFIFVFELCLFYHDYFVHFPKRTGQYYQNLKNIEF